MQGTELGSGVAGQHEGYGRPLCHLSHFSLLAEVYLQGSFKPLVYISPSDR